MQTESRRFLASQDAFLSVLVDALEVTLESVSPNAIWLDLVTYLFRRKAFRLSFVFAC